MRPVKKLRTTRLDEEEDKENIDFVASKWDEDRKDSISPKRKITGFTAINREETTACYAREHAVTIKDISTTALDDDVATDSDFTEEEETEDTHGEPDPPRSEHVASCDPSNKVLQGGMELDSPTQSAGGTVGGILIPDVDAACDASLLVQQQSGASESSQSQDIPVAAEGPMIQAANKSSNPIIADEDDTAFLHDFLSRARAQKAAKQQPEIDEMQQQAPDAMDVEEETPRHPSPVEDIEDIDGPGSPPEPSSVILHADVETEANQLSPCRRSSRLNTRLPRLQKPSTALPSSIALKRLTGTEFISQKETQSVALMTRSNTKRNKGVAKSVQERLIQLDAEAKARDSTLDAVENEKKRRRKGKEVTWAEQLTRFQVTAPVLRSTEEPTQAEISLTPHTADNNNHLESDPEPEETKIEEEKKQVRKVRKLRKQNVGTYNGTPAPKKAISLPIPVTSAFSLENCKPMSSATTSQLSTESIVQPDVKIELSVASMKSKPSTVGSEKRFQTRLRTRNRT